MLHLLADIKQVISYYKEQLQEYHGDFTMDSVTHSECRDRVLF